MSWSVNFKARTRADAERIVAADPELPEEIKPYIQSGLQALPPDKAVDVSGHGHLPSGGDYPETSATLQIVPIEFKAPPAG